MKITRAGIAVLLGTSFLTGICVGPGADRVARAFGIAEAAAQGTSQQQPDRLLGLFTTVFARVRADYVEPVTDRTLINNALNGMLTGLDPHSSYLTQQQWDDMQTETEGKFGGIGLQVTDRDGLLEVVSPIDDTPAANAGIKPGDLITAVDGHTVEGMSLDAAVAEMRGPPDTGLTLTVKRQGNNTPLQFSLTRQIIRVQSVKSRLLGDVGVIRISEFTEQTNPGVRDALQSLRAEAHGHLQGIVLDLRDDPGGLLDQAVSTANDFLDHGGIVSTRGRHPVDDDSWSARPSGDVAGNLPVVVLTNSGTASAAEIVAGALQDDRRALVLGTQSFGKGSVQTLIPIPGNGAIRLTTARYYTPNGRSIQGLGITPDIVVEESRNPQPHFGPEHEADLRNILSNPTGAAQQPAPPVDLPAVARNIQKLPPPNWPAFDAAKPSTDYQLQQALLLVHGMTAGSIQAVSR
jgi:carboxyl-terminal processing protease